MAEPRGHAPTNPQTDYERADLSLAAIAIAAAVLLAVLGLTPLIIRAAYPTTAADVDRRLIVVPPEPRLETDPPQDLSRYLAAQHARLGSYGWIDRAHGIAHVPITEAMDRLAKTGIDGFPRGAQ